MVTSLKAGSPFSHLSRHRPDSLRSRVRRCSSKGCASTEAPPKLRPRLAWALRDLTAGLPGGFRRALPTFGAWSSPRHWPLHGPLRSGRYHGRSSQAVDPAPDRGKERSRHRHLGKLEDHMPPVPHDPGADLDQLLAEGRERPLLKLPRQGQRAQEVGEVVGQGVELEPHGVVAEGVAGAAFGWGGLHPLMSCSRNLWQSDGADAEELMPYRVPTALELNETERAELEAWGGGRQTPQA